MKKSKLFALIAILFALSSSAQVRLMTYNIKYANENDGENSWSNRKEFITNQLKFYEPDILGVQEALLSQLQHFTSELDGYSFVGVGREDGEEKGEFSAILYKDEKYEVLENNTFWLSETPGKVSTGWDAALPRVCTYVLFQDKETGKKFWSFNTHFDHIGEKARQESAKLIFSRIEEINTENLPVILTGDFNLEPGTEGIQYLSEELNDSKKIAENVFGSEGTFNGYKFEEPVTRRIDYVFVNDQVEVEKYAVLTDSKEMRYPSDHFPVFVILNLK
ncbi:endonuclease/exonuclease/phosphatase family protein [Zunongwangia sp. F363]|uniref:Endonuclease/exonuclease/phosphatase family protein n=1 Tax=Autumnicola tepida TaxID=3075595 RepID=A0ABU3CA37_9FLAO|nr:endonuclease/exonuclease/phosphatase family protein [Zunongwangia sp. F363]MDT0643208.1 endonuclease/exonuclease/phosphatase family protein [Zunongwangia sp. F363]